MKNKRTKVDFSKREIKIQKVEAGNHQVKARVEIKFGDELRISGFMILKSKTPGEFFLSPPLFRGSGGRRRKIFFLENEELWREISQEVIGEFQKKEIQDYAKEEDIDDIEL